MYAIRVGEYCGAEDLKLSEVDEPTPGAGEVLVRVAASGVNFIDTYQRSGVYQVPLPWTLGMEGAGTVEALGAGVEEIAVGDRVAWSGNPGSYAERLVAPDTQLVPVPDGASQEIAAAAMLQGLTAHYLMTSTYQVRAGDTVLLHAAAGGVGLLLIQMCKAAGATVFGTASTEQKRELARAAGADEVLDYAGFAEAVRGLTGGAGVHVVYDGVGRSTFDESMASLRPRGTLVLFGGASGQVPPVDPQRLNSAGSLYLTRPTLVHYVATRDELRWRSGELFDMIARGDLDIRIGGRYPLAEAARAHADLEGRRTTGKLILQP